MAGPCFTKGEKMERKEYKPLVFADSAKLTNEEWLKLRRTGIGGSDVAALLGVSPWTTRNQLYNQKAGIVPINTDRPSNWFKLEVGHVLEPLIRESFANQSGFTVINDTAMYRHPEYPWMIGDMDFTVITDEGTLIGGEIKTTARTNLDHWAPGVLGKGGRIPFYYETQVRHYMAVCNIDRFVVICCYGFSEDEQIIVWVDRDYDFEEMLIEEEKRFWLENVEKRIPPEEDAIKKETLTQFLKDCYKGPDGRLKVKEGLVDLHAKRALWNDYSVLAEKKESAKQQVKDIENSMAAMEAEFALALGEADEGFIRLEDDRTVEVKVQITERTTADSKKLKAAYPDVWEEVKKVSESPSIRFKVRTGTAGRKLA